MSRTAFPRIFTTVALYFPRRQIYIFCSVSPSGFGRQLSGPMNGGEVQSRAGHSFRFHLAPACLSRVTILSPKDDYPTTTTTWFRLDHLQHFLLKKKNSKEFLVNFLSFIWLFVFFLKFLILRLVRDTCQTFHGRSGCCICRPDNLFLSAITHPVHAFNTEQIA